VSVRVWLSLVALLGAGALLAAGEPARAQTSEPATLAPRDDARDQPPAPRRRGQAAPRTDVPRYGNPPAFGAGASGFDSTNALRRKARIRAKQKPGQKPEPLVPPSPPRVILPSIANPPPGPMILPTRLTRHGAPPSVDTSEFNVPTTVLMPRRPPLPVQDPFDPLGVRAGAFVLRPAIEFTTGYDSNPAHVATERASGFLVTSSELAVRSDWQRHALNADLRGSYTMFNNHFDPDAPQSLDRPNVDTRVQGRIDVSSVSRVDVEGRFLLSTDYPGSPNVQVGLKRFPLVTTVGGTLGYAQRFNRFEVTVKGTIDRVAYQPSTLLDGTTSSNDDRDYDQYGGAARVAYELLPGVKPFVEAGADTRVHDLPIDRTGSQRDSSGQYVKAGSTFDFLRSVTGEFAVGYLMRAYKDPTLPELAGLTVDGTLAWTATPLTTFTLTGRSTADEIIVPGVSGVFRRDIGLQVDHAFRRWLIGTAKIGYGIDDYVGSDRLDYRYAASLGLVYKARRDLYFKGEVRRDWMHSSVSGLDWNANAVLVGVRLQK
jgi:hypothetical protein